MIRRLYGELIASIKHLYWNKFKYETHNLRYNWDSNVYSTIKKDTWETVNLSEIYQVTQGIHFRAFYPAIHLYKFSNASIFTYSDMVIENDDVMWDKAYFPTFSKTFPRDKNLLSYSNDVVKIKKYKEITIRGKCFSLTGTYAYIWSHFVLQYVSKLFLANKMGIIDENTIILAPHYEDVHLQKIVEAYINKLGAKIVYLEKNIKYVCDELYYIPTTCSTPNVCKYLLPQDYVMPEITKQAIKESLVLPYLSFRDDKKNYKLYLVRRNGARKLLNWKEVEAFFDSEGFIFVEPHKLSLEEKIELFSNASIIVGPFSSAFTNIIWCKSNCKVLMLSNHPRTVESSFCELGDIANVSMMYLTGDDTEKNNPHSDFYIDIKKVRECYEYICNK